MESGGTIELMGKESIIIKMEPNMLGNGSMINNKGLGKSTKLMDQYIVVSFTMG